MGINLSLKDVESSLSSFLPSYIAHPIAMVLNAKGYQYIPMNSYEAQKGRQMTGRRKIILDLS